SRRRPSSSGNASRAGIRWTMSVRPTRPELGLDRSIRRLPPHALARIEAPDKAGGCATKDLRVREKSSMYDPRSATIAPAQGTAAAEQSAAAYPDARSMAALARAEAWREAYMYKRH